MASCTTAVRRFIVAAATLAAAATSTAAPPGRIMDDPRAYLEEVTGDRALAWVRGENARTLEHLMADPRFAGLQADALAIAEDRERIPTGLLRDGFLYNFWQDADHVRGIWRRSPVEAYRRNAPEWETLFDLDAFAAADGHSWVWKGAWCAPLPSSRCMLTLSEGGQDASVSREFDLASRAFVPDGFVIPEAKHNFDWEDADTLLIGTDWGPGTLTPSGYPFVIKRWHRGMPITQAREVMRGSHDDVGVNVGSAQDAEGHRLVYVVRNLTFFTQRYASVTAKGVEPITLPERATLRALQSGQFVAALEQDWTVAGRHFASGSLISMPLASIHSPKPVVTTVVDPGPRASLETVAATSAGLLVAGTENVRGRLVRYRFAAGAWTAQPIGLPDNGSVTLATADEQSTLAFATYSNYEQPDTLYAIDVDAARADVVRAKPSRFDEQAFVTEQFEATSRDGTRVPYFVVHRRGQVFDGSAPTLLYGYGGFQVSLLPDYSANIGKLWLERGGVYVLANIRGGGEFGPAWHQAGLKTKRQVVYDDFIAVAEDVIARRISSPRRLGIEGGSNGGLLMGVMLTQRPELFHAAVVQVPLLDMLRYDRLLAGASWVDEYGSPSVPAERAWLEKLSPYANLRKRDDFPEPFLVTSTRDDRVHPGHARKYAAKMQSLGMPFWYYENIEGGHSAAANLQEAAKRRALEYTYLMQRLVD